MSWNPNQGKTPISQASMVATLRHRHNPSQPILTAARKQASRRDTDSRAAMDSSKAVSNTVDISRHKVVISNLDISRHKVVINRDHMERLHLGPRARLDLPLWACNPMLQQA